MPGVSIAFMVRFLFFFGGKAARSTFVTNHVQQRVACGTSSMLTVREMTVPYYVKNRPLVFITYARCMELPALEPGFASVVSCLRDGAMATRLQAHSVSSTSVRSQPRFDN